MVDTTLQWDAQYQKAPKVGLQNDNSQTIKLSWNMFYRSFKAETLWHNVSMCLAEKLAEMHCQHGQTDLRPMFLPDACLVSLFVFIQTVVFSRRISWRSNDEESAGGQMIMLHKITSSLINIPWE